MCDGFNLVVTHLDMHGKLVKAFGSMWPFVRLEKFHIAMCTAMWFVQIDPD